MFRLFNAGTGLKAGAALAVLATAALVALGPVPFGDASANTPAQSAAGDGAPTANTRPAPTPPVQRTAQIVVAQLLATHPHDSSAFTQGLFFSDGRLFETTGHHGKSFIQELDLKTGKPLRQVKLAQEFFGEGSTNWGNTIISLTWQNGRAFVWDRDTLRKIGEFSYPGEGWGLTNDGKQLIMSDGTAQLRFLNPNDFSEQRRITVTFNGRAIRYLNELEYVRGEIWANVWFQDVILRIDPADGTVIGVLDLRAIAATIPNRDTDTVLNGIAYNDRTGKLYVTGKYWPKLFEIALPDDMAATQIN